MHPAGLGRRGHRHAAYVLALAALVRLASASERRLQPQDLGISATYDASRFTAQAQVARDLAAALSELEDAATPAFLKSMLTQGLRMFPEIYGSCIAFEPDTYPLKNGRVDASRADLKFGVPSTSGVNTDGKSYWSRARGRAWTLDSTEIAPGVDAILYAPYAHKGAGGENMPTYMDIADSYNYMQNESTWFLVPRKRFLEGSLNAEPFQGYWTEPYFDENAGNISMVTFSVPFWRRTPVASTITTTRSSVPDQHGRPRYFWGIATIDIALGLVNFSCNASEVWDSTERRCRKCSVGSYKSGSQESACRRCGRGTYSNVAGLTECFRCGIGRYQSELGKSSCLSCEDLVVGGTTPFLGASRGSDCACPAGSYQSAHEHNGSRHCVACQAGTYADQPGLAACTLCPYGKVSSIGASTCGCPVGSEDDGESCEKCPVGFYKNTLRGKCLRCPFDQRSGRHLITSAEGATSIGECKLPVEDHDMYVICFSSYCLRPEMLVVVVLALMALVLLMAYIAYLRMHVDSVWVVSPGEMNFGDPVEVLGRGSFGFVVRAEYRGTSVAVKRVIPPTLKGGTYWSTRIFGKGEADDCFANCEKAMGRVPTEFSAATPDVLERGCGGLDTMVQLPPSHRTLSCPTPHTRLGNDIKTPMSNKSVASVVRCGMSVVSSDPHRRLKRDFIREMRVLSKLRHPCVTTVMGAVISSKHDPMLVMELMDHGSLYDILHNSTMLLEGALVLPILRDVAQGLRFLHAARPVVIHGDLKSANVLVDAKFRAKVTDFGLSQKAKVGHCGTPFWMAPEVLDGAPLTRASDVYAFGILLSEVYAGDPYQGMDSEEVLMAVRDPEQQLRPDVPPNCIADVAVLMRDCWRASPELRPSFDELDRRLKSLDVAVADATRHVSLQESKEEKARRTDNLLFDVFPKHVAEALRDGRKVEPESKDTVTIFFSDIVGFTEISAQLEPQKVSLMLDRLYSQFDQLSREYSVFKVETIGDAYMAVTNLVEDQQSDHAKRIACFALRAIDVANQTPIDEDDPERGYVNIRVGFHTGHVVASVVGTRNLRYCLFGDTVNTASRMESNSKMNCILCSKESARHLHRQAPEVKVTSRGIIHVKGKGEMETFWVSGMT